MRHHDAAGLPLTLEDSGAAVAWDRVVTGFLAHSAATPGHLDEVLRRAPRFALAWAAKGMFYLLLGRSELKPVAAEALARARDGIAAGGATWREQRHVEALAAYLAGKPSGAVQMLDAILERHPEDSLAMKLGHAIRFVLGDARGMRRAMQAVIGGYGPDHAHSGYAMGCMAFALEECGVYGEAERWGKAGIERAPDDAWGLHAVAHVHDMTGRSGAGIAWLAPQAHRWAHCNNFGYHVWWHLALFHLDRSEFDRVLELYDTKVRAEHTDDYRDIANGASMLVRLEIEGVDVGDRWDELAALAAGRVEDGAVVFADLHYLLALHGGARDAEAEQLVARLAFDAQRCDHEMHEVAAVAGLPTAQGLAAFRAGNYDLAFERLAESRPVLERIGGSHAQRDVFSRLLIEAGLRAGRWRDAERELRGRAARRGAEDGFTSRRRAAIARLAAAGLAAE
jgi:tetratricopeptide (TPR) repeat protein